MGLSLSAGGYGLTFANCCELFSNIIVLYEKRASKEREVAPLVSSCQLNNLSSFTFQKNQNVKCMFLVVMHLATPS